MTEMQDEWLGVFENVVESREFLKSALALLSSKRHASGDSVEGASSAIEKCLQILEIELLNPISENQPHLKIANGDLVPPSTEDFEGFSWSKANSNRDNELFDECT